MTRVETAWRPFLGLGRQQLGGDRRGARRAPLRACRSCSASSWRRSRSRRRATALGAVTHARVIGAYVSDHLSLGLGVGSRLQRFGTSGLSLAPSAAPGQPGRPQPVVDLHAHDRAQQIHGQADVGFSNMLAKIQVPVARTLALQLDTGMSLDTWAYATLGLRHRLFGDGGRGKLVHQRRVRRRDGRRQDACATTAPPSRAAARRRHTARRCPSVWSIVSSQ